MSPLRPHLLPLALLLVACGSDEATVQQPSTDSHSLTFIVSNYRQFALDEVTRSQNAATPLPHLLLAVFDAETSQRIKMPVTQDWSDFANASDSYGHFSVSLPDGHYRLLFLGYEKDHVCTVSETGIVSWDGGYVPNTFLCCRELTLTASSSSAASEAITLHRAVSALRMTVTDALPQNIARVLTHFSAGSNQLSALNGYGVDDKGYTSSISIPSNYIGYTGAELTSYVFLPSDEATMDVEVSAVDASEAILGQRLLLSVPLRRNVLTTTSTNLFSTDHPFTVDWDSAWSDTISYVATDK